MDITKPLYRYRPAYVETETNGKRENVLEVKELIEKNLLRFSSPSTFNDPFDCQCSISFKDASKKDYERFRSREIDRGGTNSKSDKNDEIKREVDDWKTVKRQLSKKIEDTRNTWTEPFYICCFSETCSDILMWSHYANKHQGFFLVFSGEKLGTIERSVIKKIDYEENYPAFREFVDGYCSTDEYSLNSLFLLRKSSHWKYEKEWRIITVDENSKEENIPKSIPEDALTGIIFGCQCEPSTIEDVKNLVQEHKPHLKLQKAVKSKTSYTLEIVDL